jgi:DNA-binding transcriptional ArsR family regulator
MLLHHPAGVPAIFLPGVSIMAKGIRIDQSLVKSKAFSLLSAGAIKVYLRFLMKRRMSKCKRKGQDQWIQTNNGELVFTYSEAKKELEMPPSTFMNCIDRLIEAGLIDIEHSGSGGRKGDVTLYAISERWRLYGTDGFITKQRPKDTRSGRGFAHHPEYRKDKSKK